MINLPLCLIVCWIKFFGLSTLLSEFNLIVLHHKNNCLKAPELFCILGNFGFLMFLKESIWFLKTQAFKRKLFNLLCLCFEENSFLVLKSNRSEEGSLINLFFVFFCQTFSPLILFCVNYSTQIMPSSCFQKVTAAVCW